MSKEQQKIEKQRKLYEGLSRQYTSQELAESFVFPSEHTEEKEKAVHQELVKLRMERLRNMTEEEVMFDGLLRMKYRIEDYVKSSSHHSEFSFGNQLKEYLRITHRSQAGLSDEIDIDKTRMSKLINDKIKPNLELCYRLEKHSDKIISAKHWFKLYLKELEKTLEMSPKMREKEYRAGEVKFIVRDDRLTILCAQHRACVKPARAWLGPLWS